MEKIVGFLAEAAFYSMVFLFFTEYDTTFKVHFWDSTNAGIALAIFVRAVVFFVGMAKSKPAAAKK